MERPYLVILALAFSCQGAFTQNYAIFHELDDPLSPGQSYAYIARDYISLKPGFYYNPWSASHEFAGRIEEDGVYPASYLDDPISVAGRQLDLSLPVGTTAGSQAVSLTGAATYTVPITVPPGTAGMEPSLALSYNSQGGNGLLGIGWNLSGLSAITRVTKTLYHDGIVEGVDFNDDRFTLDGNRLFVISGPYGMSGSQYYTEVFTGSRIFSMDYAGSGPKYFIVETKDGRTIWYGNSEDSRIEAEGRNDVLVWNINRIEDKSGNYIEFYYYEAPDHTEHRITEIRYTGNSQVSPPLPANNRIHFYYAEREDKCRQYVAGSRIEMRSLLFRVCSYAGDELARKYEMNYHHDFYSHLVEVIEYGSDGGRFNSTVFEWENSGYQTPSGPQLNSENYDYYSGNFNDDGICDLLAAHYYMSGGIKYYYSYDILRGPNFNSVSSGSLTNNATDPRTITVGDFNGDGMSDIIMTYCLAGNQDDWYYLKWLTVNQGFGFDCNNTWFWCVTGVASWEYPFDRILTGDFNGDMREDIVFDLRVDYQTSWVVNVMKPDKNSVDPYSGTVNNSDMKVADFSGDGKDDLMLIQKDVWTNQSCLIYELEEGGFVLKHYNGYPTQAHAIFTGDFNGDGKEDLLTWSAGQWELNYFKDLPGFGLEWSPITSWPGYYSYNPEESPDNHNYHVADFNNDGKSDILESFQLQYGSRYVLFHFNGDTFDESIPYDVEIAKPCFNKDMLGDFNGDGRLDLLTSPDYLNYLTIYFNHRKPRHHVTYLADGLNLKASFTYLPLTNENVYTRYAGSFQNSVYEMRDIQYPMYVVSEEKSENGIGGKFTMHYAYEGARIHLKGKGFLGFQKTTQSLEMAQGWTYREVVNSYDNDASFFNIINTSTIVQIKTSADEASSPAYDIITEDFYEHMNKTGYEPAAPYKVYMPYVSVATSLDHKNKLKSKVENTVDDYGNPTVVLLKTFAEDGLTVEGSETTITTYLANGSWCNHLPQHVCHTSVRGGEAFSLSKDYQYDNKGLLVSQVDFAGLPKAVTTSFTHDLFGNITSQTISASQLEARAEHYTYDNQGRFVVVKTDALGNQAFSTFDKKLGLMKTLKDISGLVTRTYYDGFGRPVKSRLPDNTTTDQSYHWYQGSLPNVCYYTTQVTSGAPTTYTFYDILGRERIAVTENLTGPSTCVQTIYDGHSRVSRVSEPYYEGAQPAQWTFHSYLDDGRPATTVFPAATVVYAYDGRTSTSTNSTTGITKSREINSFGETKTVTDPGGMMQYAYFPSGLPKSVTAPDGSAFTMEYDAYGRQTSLCDPDAKTTLYIYNAYGELQSQTDAEGSTFTMSYDKLGRIIQKSCNDGSVTIYAYITEGNGKGQVGNVSSSNGIEYSYEYDGLSRMVAENEVIDEQHYTSSYTYDEFGNLKDIVYPTGFGIRKTYSKGFLIGVTRLDNGSVLYQNPSYNERGQITTYQLGNGLTCQREYDQYGFPKKIYTGTIQKLEYTFYTPTGNLVSRKDVNFNLQETFAYDSEFKSRLTAWYPSQQNYSANYLPNGNLNYKSDVGSYHYEYNMAGGSGGPHSVTRISSPVTMPSEYNQAIEYTPFNKVKSINHYGQAYHMDFIYGPDQERRKTMLQQGDPTDANSMTLIKTKYFIGGNFEKETDGSGNTRLIHYIAGGDGLLAVYIIERGAGTLYYAHKDHLGSLYALSDQNGNIASYKGQQQVFNFDPWGRRRNPTDWTFTGVPVHYLIDRGYTGHEHLDRLELINMNGRLYDPLMGRFLSPDNYVQAPDNSQGFNRYSYCLNNPLVYTDPDGEFWHLIISAAIGGTINWLSHGSKFSLEGLGYFGIGAVAGALGAGIGAGVNSTLAAGGSFGAGFIGSSTVVSTGFASGFVSGAAGGFIGGFVSGFGNATMEPSNSLGDMFESGLDYGWKGAATGGIVGGVIGGIDAVNHDRNFGTGAGKQDVVVKVNTQGTGELISGTDYDASYTTQSTRDYYKTTLDNNASVTTNANGQVRIKIPNEVNRITGIQAPNNTLLMDIEVGRNFITFTPLDRINYVILHGWRYHSNPVTLLRDLFHFRTVFSP